MIDIGIDEKSPRMIIKIISSAECEFERAALDAAIELGLSCSDCGTAKHPGTDKLQVKTLKTQRRIEENVFDSDGTAIFYVEKMDHRCQLSRKITNLHGFPCVHFDLASASPDQIASDLRVWASINKVRRLHFVGSKDPDNAGLPLKEAVRCSGLQT